MARRHRTVPARPPQWQPLVSPSQWEAVAEPLGDSPELLDDLLAVLTQLSPAVRGVLVANLVLALDAEAPPARAIWMAVAITGYEVKLCSAIAIGRLDALGKQAPFGDVRPIRPAE